MICRKIQFAALKFNFILVLLFSILLSGKANGQTVEPILKIHYLGHSAFADVTSIEKNYSAPVEFKLNQNYPNPFNPTTIIKFTILNVETTRRVVFTKLTIFDILGREVATLVSEEKRPGNYEVKFNILSAAGRQGLSSSVYYYKITAGSFSQTRKMILVQ